VGAAGKGRRTDNQVAYDAGKQGEGPQNPRPGRQRRVVDYGGLQRIGEGTFTGTRANDENAPKAATYCAGPGHFESHQARAACSVGSRRWCFQLHQGRLKTEALFRDHVSETELMAAGIPLAQHVDV